MRKRTIILIIALVVIAIAVFFIYQSMQQAQAAAETQFDTVQIERGSLTALVGATGTVRANQTAILTWQTAGQIETIAVMAGDTVSADQVLAELLRSSLPQTVILAEADLATARRALEDLQNSDVAAAEAQLALVNAIQALDDANDERASKDYRRASDETLETARANYLLAENEVDKWETIFDRVDNRTENDPERLAALSAYMDARKKRDIALANYEYLQRAPNADEVAEADAAVTLAEAQLEVAQREYDRLKNGPTEADLAAAQARIDAAEATINMARLKAPFAGEVTQVLSKVGDQVAPATISFRIDDLSRLLVDVQVTEVDINRVQMGQPATLTFDAILGKEYNGEVVEVAPVGENVQGVVNFNVTVELTDADEAVRPGMTAAVNMVVSQLDDILIVPNRAIRLRDGQRTIYLLKNGVLTPVTIRIGASSDTNSEIIAGDVQEGDVVVLNPPAVMEGGPGFMR